MTVLAGDIGGTKTLLTLADCRDGRVQTRLERRYGSNDYPDLQPMVADFLAGARAEGLLLEPPGAACFGVSGPILADASGRQEVRVTNLPWQLDNHRLANALGLSRVHFINDFQATGYGVEALAPEDLATLQDGEEMPRGVRVLLGAGTGLGVALMTWDGDRYVVQPSEGGHADFAPIDDLQIELLAHLRREHDRVSYETLLSGAGLSRLYRFFRERVGRPLATGESDDPATVSGAGLDGSDPAAVDAMHTFTRIYGAQAGNLALTMLALGGVYLAGGIAPRIVSALQAGAFLDAFHAKGRMRDLMGRIPVRVILNPRVGLLGAALAASRL